MAIKVRTGNQWLPVSGGGGESVGVIMAWGGSSGSIPSGYLLCDGSAISRTTYSDLFSTIGVTHGSGDGSNTFNIPNLKDKFIVGASSGTGDTTYPGLSVGASGGSANSVLVAHTHTYIDQYVVINAGYRPWPANNNDCQQRNINTGTTGKNADGTSNTSQDGSNANLPPYYAVCYIIKVFNTNATVTGGVGGSLTVQNSGSQLSSTASVINFSTGLTASGSGSNITVTSSGGSSGGSNYQSFTSSGTWTKPASGNFVFIYMWAGGGGGGTGGYKMGGGGAGGVAEYQIPMSALPSSVSVTVGSGGSPGNTGGFSQFYNSNYIVYGGGQGAATNDGTDEQILAGGGGVGGIFSVGGTNRGGGNGSYDDSGTWQGYSSLFAQGAGVGGNAFAVGSNNANYNNADHGGDNVYTGGGGGARNSLGGGVNAPGGTSRLAGDGGAGNSNGSAPAGGGGGGASGGNGEVRVVVV